MFIIVTKGSFCFNIFTTRVISVEVLVLWLFPALFVAIFAVGELVEGLLTVAPPAGVACVVGVVAAVVFVGVAALATPPREVEEAARLEAEPPRLVADEGLSFVHISARNCDHGSECCKNKRMTLDSAPPVPL